MGHYAKVVDGIVTQVIVAEAEFFDTFVDTEPGKWVQTSYNTRGGVHYEPNSNTPSNDQSKALRKNYAGIGWIYDFEKDVFYEQQPYPSWTLNDSTCMWEAPSAKPDDGIDYYWDENSKSWKENVEN